MTLEFLDGTQLEVIRIFGGPRMINGISRDTLSIEVDPSEATIEELRNLFSDSSKTNNLFLYLSNEANTTETKSLVAEGYNILVSCRKETRKIDRMPGMISRDEYEDINIVNISQLTYDEYQQFIEGIWTPPIIDS